MAELKDVVAYLLAKYPYKSELSNARVTKLVYLADWHACLNKGTQITGIEWYFDNYGPYVHDVKKMVESHPDLFKMEATQNMYGDRKVQFTLQKEDYEPRLTEDERASLDKVIELTKFKTWGDFIKFVYGTFPIQSSARYSTLNLEEKAKEFATQDDETK